MKLCLGCIPLALLDIKYIKKKCKQFFEGLMNGQIERINECHGFVVKILTKSLFTGGVVCLR